MPGGGLRITDDSLARNLARYSPARLERVVAKRLDTIGAAIVDIAWTLVPVRTGYLQSTIYFAVDGMELSVGATADYATYIEYGTRFMTAQPFLRPAWDGFVKEAELVFSDIIAEAFGLWS